MSMKANELMVGDWVYYDGYPMKITELKYKRRGEPPYEQICSVEGVGVGFENVRIDPIKGIPLTPEILEKNGFEKENLITFYNHYTGIDNRVSLRDYKKYMNSRNMWYVHVDSEDYSTIAGCELTYLHELQQLLKLCKIDFEFTV